MNKLFVTLILLIGVLTGFMSPACGAVVGFGPSYLAANRTTAIRPYFPANNGFLGATEKQFLMPDQTIDRFGGSGYSRFFSPAGTSEAARTLPAGSAGQQLRSFEVMKPFPVDAGTVAPAFGQRGLGQQFVTPVRLETLLKRGILRESP